MLEEKNSTEHEIYHLDTLIVLCNRKKILPTLDRAARQENHQQSTLAFIKQTIHSCYSSNTECSSQANHTEACLVCGAVVRSNV